jgi:hypothetical protein
LISKRIVEKTVSKDSKTINQAEMSENLALVRDDA